jgi:hypothetical protein
VRDPGRRPRVLPLREREMGGMGATPATGGIVLSMDDDPRRRPRLLADERSAETQAEPDSTTLRSLMNSRLDGFRRFNTWEKRERAYLPFEVALCSADDLRKLVSEETRDRDSDPERAGVRRMHEILGRLSHSPRRTGGLR